MDGAATHGAEDEAMVAELLAAAGGRPALPAEELAQVRAMVRQAWQQRAETVDERLESEGSTAPPAAVDAMTPVPSAAPVPHPRWAQRRAVALGMAMAAGVALAIGLVWWRNVRPVPSAAAVAAVEAVTGYVRVGGAPRALAVVGASLPAGAELQSGSVASGRQGFASLRLAGGGNVRLDAGTRLRLLGRDEIALDEGAVYVDSGANAAAKLVVRSPLGDVRELGTQFTVRLAAGARELRIRVREGAVAAASGGGRRHTARAGEELVLDREGHAAVHAAASSGEDWAWVLAAAPPFAGDGRTVAELLDWVSRETGWRLRFEGDAARAATTSVLHGDVGALPPDRAAFALLPGAGLEAELRDGTLIVRAAP